MRAIPEDLRALLREHGAAVTSSRDIDHGTQHRIERGSESVPLNLYYTGNISIGGKESDLRRLIQDWWASTSGKAVSGEGGRKSQTARPALDARARVGIDEAGKGDYFGPLVVAGVRVSGEQAARALHEIGVRDSKVFSANGALRLAERIKSSLGSEDFRVVSLSPGEYETRRKQAGNVNRLLAEVNVEIIYNLAVEVEKIVVDEYARSARSYLELRVPEGVHLEVRTRAEDDAAVAAASILARARYLEEMEKLSELVVFELPRGTTHVVEAARRVVEERGPDGLAEVAKVHFGTTQQVLSNVDKQRKEA